MQEQQCQLNKSENEIEVSFLESIHFCGSHLHFTGSVVCCSLSSAGSSLLQRDAHVTVAVRIFEGQGHEIVQGDALAPAQDAAEI